MPRASLILQDQYPYNITGRCVNREWFAQPMDYVWEVMAEQLNFIHHAFGVSIHSFVLMSNHFHLVMSTPQANLSSAMQRFMLETGRSLAKPSHRVNQTFGSRYYRSILGSNRYYLHAYKYLYANPLKAGLVQRVEEYKYSTLSGLLGLHKLFIPVQEDLTLFSDVEGTLAWLNRMPTEDNWHAVRKGLRRKHFALAKVRSKDHPLEVEVL